MSYVDISGPLNASKHAVLVEVVGGGSGSNVAVVAPLHSDPPPVDQLAVFVENAVAISHPAWDDPDNPFPALKCCIQHPTAGEELQFPPIAVTVTHPTGTDLHPISTTVSGTVSTNTNIIHPIRGDPSTTPVAIDLLHPVVGDSASTFPAIKTQLSGVAASVTVPISTATALPITGSVSVTNQPTVSIAGTVPVSASTALPVSVSGTVAVSASSNLPVSVSGVVPVSASTDLPVTLGSHVVDINVASPLTLGCLNTYVANLPLSSGTVPVSLPNASHVVIDSSANLPVSVTNIPHVIVDGGSTGGSETDLLENPFPASFKTYIGGALPMFYTGNPTVGPFSAAGGGNYTQTAQTTATVGVLWNKLLQPILGTSDLHGGYIRLVLDGGTQDPYLERGYFRWFLMGRSDVTYVDSSWTITNITVGNNRGLLPYVYADNVRVSCNGVFEPISTMSGTTYYNRYRPVTIHLTQALCECYNTGVIYILVSYATGGNGAIHNILPVIEACVY